MKTFLSTPSIISALGNNLELLEQLSLGKKNLCNVDFYGKEFCVGKIDDNLLDLNFIRNTEFNTRTNAIALSAILPLQSQIKSLAQKYGSDKIGVVVANTTTGVEENFVKFHKGEFPKDFSYAQNSLWNPAEFLKEFLGLKGIAYGISTACTSGIKAISEARDLLKAGICKAVVAGGVDSLNTLTLYGFHSLSILSNNPCNPFGADRNGTNLGEGACFMIVGDDGVGEVCLKSVVSNCDAFHLTTPREDGYYQTLLINQALKEAKLNDVDYLNLHATGTLANDKMESAAVFASVCNAPCSGVKQSIGHTLGAAGAIESGICALLLQKSCAIPLQNISGELDSTLPKIPLITQPKEMQIKNAMSLSFAFGGDNACIVLGVDNA